MTVQENRSHVLNGGASLNSKDGVVLATGGVLTQKERKKVVKDCILQCKRDCFAVMEIELDLKREWKNRGGWEPQKRY